MIVCDVSKSFITFVADDNYNWFAYETSRIIDTHILDILEKRFSFILRSLKFGD